MFLENQFYHQSCEICMAISNEEVFKEQDVWKVAPPISDNGGNLLSQKESVKFPYCSFHNVPNLEVTT